MQKKKRDCEIQAEWGKNTEKSSPTAGEKPRFAIASFCIRKNMDGCTTYKDRLDNVYRVRIFFLDSIWGIMVPRLLSYTPSLVPLSFVGSGPSRGPFPVTLSFLAVRDLA
jgi:hypothetical protein